MSAQFLDILFNAVGIVGVAMIIITYFLLQAGKMKHDEMAYPVINLIGAIFITISLLRFWNLASFIIEIFWIAISLYGIWRVLRKRKS
jgi:predicted membrane protein